MTPRGVRNNNPGNLRHSSDRWMGQALEQPDKDFVTFTAPEFGIRALSKTLLTYQDHYGLKSIDQLVGRWAPGTENDTDAYQRAVAYSTGFTRTEPLNLRLRAHAEPLVKAIIQHENGQQPYSEEVIDDALNMAGVTV